MPVAVIVPARDERANLLRLLPSLLCLEPPPAEILVVDDRSTDGTAEIAAGFGVRVVTASEPPSGWSGKNNACVFGAAQTQMPWLLFADADTWQAPASLGTALAVAEAAGADLLSVFPRQECMALWEQLLLPFAFAHYLAAINADAANDDGAPSAVANGQYFLIRRDMYERIGGHGAVQASLGEDVALAGLVRRAGGRVRLYRADELVRVRMYRSLGGLQTGFRKFMAGYLLANPRDGLVIVASTALAGLPLIRLAGWLAGHNTLRLALASYLVGVLAMIPWTRWFGAGRWTALLQPVAYALFQAIALDAGLRWLLGVRVTWKGRRYRV
ncbi:MAG: glycosyltransferase family 2 protein [Chloroflexota bacterium]